jgi:hypothetical protein
VATVTVSEAITQRVFTDGGLEHSDTEIHTTIPHCTFCYQFGINTGAGQALKILWKRKCFTGNQNHVPMNKSTRLKNL